MDLPLGRLFLDCSAKRLSQLSGRITACVERLSNDQIWTRGSESENAIGNLILHLCGNLRQWIGCGLAGKPDIRDRDSEFAARDGEQADVLRERLRATVEETVSIIGRLPVEQLGESVTIQGYQVTRLEAVYHVVEHFAQHTGQIIYATKLLTGQDLGFYRHLSGAPRSSGVRHDP